MLHLFLTALTIFKKLWLWDYVIFFNIYCDDMDLECHSPGLFVAPATRRFCVAEKDLNGLEIHYISVHQHSGGEWDNEVLFWASEI